MIRNHTLFSYTVTHELQVMVPDPEAPGGGEMVRSGEVVLNPVTVRIVAESRAIADVWLLRPYSGFTKLRIISCIENKIDAFIETHTW